MKNKVECGLLLNIVIAAIDQLLFEDKKLLVNRFMENRR
jgi:hypothetical protein